MNQRIGVAIVQEDLSDNRGPSKMKILCVIAILVFTACAPTPTPKPPVGWILAVVMQDHSGLFGGGDKYYQPYKLFKNGQMCKDEALRLTSQGNHVFDCIPTEDPGAWGLP